MYMLMPQQWENYPGINGRNPRIIGLYVWLRVKMANPSEQGPVAVVALVAVVGCRQVTVIS